MATAYGSNTLSLAFGSRAVIDLSVTAANKEIFIVPAGFEGYLDINRSILHVVEAVGAATTPAVVTLSYTASGGSAVAVATFTTAAGVAINTIQIFTPASGYEHGVRLSAGDTVMIDHTTAASGGTTTGNVWVHLGMEIRSLSR